MEIVPLTINPSDPLGEIASCSHVLNFYWSGNVGSFLMVWRQSVLLTRAITNILLRWKLRHLQGYFGLMVSLSQQAKKKSTVLGEAIYQEEIGLLLQNRGKKDYECWSGHPIGLHMVPDSPITKDNGRLQQLNAGRGQKV